MVVSSFRKEGALAKKYEYKFVSVKLRGGFFTGRVKEDYQDDIVSKARDGWRFVQAFAPFASVGRYGIFGSGYADLIFEREIEEK